MKLIFEQYGKQIISVIAAAGVLIFILIGSSLYGQLQEQSEMEHEIQYSQGLNAMDYINHRAEPTFITANTQIYSNRIFKPKELVTVIDEDGEPCDIIVNSINLTIYQNHTLKTINMTEHYNKTDDVIILNNTHYTDEHTICDQSEYDSFNKIINQEAYNMVGYVEVNYKATDKYGKSASSTITFTINANEIA